jgi:hypothetical protein
MSYAKETPPQFEAAVFVPNWVNDVTLLAFSEQAHS